MCTQLLPRCPWRDGHSQCVDVTVILSGWTSGLSPWAITRQASVTLHVRVRSSALISLEQHLEVKWLDCV